MTDASSRTAVNDPATNEINLRKGGQSLSLFRTKDEELTSPLSLSAPWGIDQCIYVRRGMNCGTDVERDEVAR
jgi:hypothetical protein